MFELNEECGIFGGFSKNENIAPIIKTGLFKLQHRGQESAGISAGDFKQTLLKAKGLVMEALPNHAVNEISGHFGIGHVRYSTQGGATPVNAQPYLIHYMEQDVSIAHNGNVARATKLRKKFEQIGEVFITSSDSEVILKRIVYGLKKPPSNWTFDEIGKCLNEDFSKGAFSLLFCLPSRVIGFRDPLGYRPLTLCVADEGYFLSSEDVAFGELNVQKIIEIEAGCGVEITQDGYTIKRFAPAIEEKKCVFEHIYFANPASTVFSKNVYQTRVQIGHLMAKNDDVKADVVVPVMDSGFASAIGYCEYSKIPLGIGLLRNHWVGRSFIEPTKQSRIEKVRAKLTPIKSVVNGKRVVLIDDSLVRGTTSCEIIDMLKKAGALEIHFRLASPMLLNTCEWGVDIPTIDDLIAVKCKNEEEIARKIGCDSVKYLPFDELKEMFGLGWCYNCFKRKGETEND